VCVSESQNRDLLRENLLAGGARPKKGGGQLHYWNETGRPQFFFRNVVVSTVTAKLIAVDARSSENCSSVT
jgi:hypothetical protein